jgi:hypothetical protein
MKYADGKLREEEQRAQKYLESCSGSVQVVSTLQNSFVMLCVSVLVKSGLQRLRP